MLLKYIGIDGLYGLEEGRVYRCSVRTMFGYIWVQWGNRGDIDPARHYESFSEFFDDWQEVGEGA